MICEGLSEEEKVGRRWKPYFLDDLMRTLAFWFFAFGSVFHGLGGTLCFLYD